ncbi:DUF2971 domain-containing protein [Limnohabitans sp.]|uniref:DUF2971 domain-containing protein n=1 Tax=Limnohabitans sp. TaxID=1907725 RepID=UPI00333E1AEC
MRKDHPRKLYKYFPPERTAFFNDLLVRYSQLGSFNDPFEGRPEISTIVPDGDFLQKYKKIGNEEFEKVFEALPAHVKHTITINQVYSLADHMMRNQIDSVHEAISSVTPLVANFFTGKIDNLLGVFCLSEVPDSLLMWAHYGASHEGFVVEFDACHPYFDEAISEEDDLRHIRRVQYRETRPSAQLSEMSASELFLVKSQHWAYENEWRIVRPLDSADKILPGDPYPTSLFRIPKDAVTGVIFGARIKQEKIFAIRQDIAENFKQKNVSLRQAMPDASHFLLQLKELE